MDKQSTKATQSELTDEVVNDEQAPSESPSKKLLGGCIPQLPPWVVVALMILALMITAVVIRRIAGPLSDLVFGTETEVPIPDGATLVSEEEGGSAARTMRYSTQQDACVVYRFYLSHQGVECTSTPNACTSEGMINLNENTSSFRTVGSCRKTESNTVSGFSWEVIISGGYAQGPATQFFISVFE